MIGAPFRTAATGAYLLRDAANAVGARLELLARTAEYDFDDAWQQAKERVLGPMVPPGLDQTGPPIGFESQAHFDAYLRRICPPDGMSCGACPYEGCDDGWWRHREEGAA